MIVSPVGEYVLYETMQEHENLIQDLLNDIYIYIYLQYVFSTQAGYETIIGDSSVEKAKKIRI